MKNLIQNFPNQIRESINISKNLKLPIDRTITNVIICGMGGSGIGAELIKNWSFDTMKLPLDIIHDYHLPASVSRNSLVILSSYSGNTAETISCAHQALDKGALLIGISSGGSIEKLLRDSKSYLVKIPEGMPPRAALGYSLVQLAAIFKQLNFLEEDIIEEIHNSSLMLEKCQSEIIERAKLLNENAIDKKFIFYGEKWLSSVLLRACQQLNENSKELAHYNIIPELNHNEIVGWSAKNEDEHVLFVRSKFESVENAKRIDITYKILSDLGRSVEIVFANGDSKIAEQLYLIHLLDWLSFDRAETNKVDIMEVKVIDYLKKELES